ncbi:MULTISPECIES: plasmid partition protein ParG [unclassified Bartonella]|uniref:plasmid partition protein ParG n=1 Tax=unclassified Bartonella TaxID=2645622 RepID=UPI0035CEC964
MNKKIKIGTKPTNKSIPLTADAWVGSHKGSISGGMKRLTIDIPESLHRLIKVSCASRGTKIADEVRELLSQKYGKV